jgi:inosine/xanthosine triphosphatase
VLKAVIGSKNPAKIKAVEKALLSLDLAAEIINIDVDSGVSNQPISDQETVNGAIHRAKQALLNSEADIAVGLEGGVVLEQSKDVMICNWGALVDREGNEYIAGGARIPLPGYFKGYLLKGMELGDLMDEYCQRKDVSKQEGAVGIFTDGAVTRGEMFEHVSKLLLGQWLYNLKKQV